jgi:hypothetical protein
MPTWQVDFTKEFSIRLMAATREEAFFAAMKAVEDHEIDYDWETGDWEAFVYKKPAKLAPDHGVKDGQIVNIEDVPPAPEPPGDEE